MNGSAALRIDRNTGSAGTGWVLPNIYASPDTDYQLTGYFLSGNEASTKARVSLVYYNPNGEILATHDSGPLGHSGAGWKEFTLASHAPLGAVTMEIRLTQDADPGMVVLFDGIRLKIPGLEGEYDYTGKREDEGTGLKYFGARFYDAEVGRFMNLDPKKAGGNWFAYCDNNPNTRIDPDGKDYILLNMKDAAFKYGHNASLVGNNKDGWTYYSKDGQKAGNAKEVYKSLKDFLESKTAEKYDRGYRIPTTPEQDKKMKAYGDKNYKRPYSVKEQAGPPKKENCADLSAGVGKAGGIDISQPKSVLGFTVPNSQYEQVKEDNEGKEITFSDDDDKDNGDNEDNG